MPVIRTCVLLFGYPAGQSLNLHGDVQWYRNYVFGPVFGQAGYWIRQSDGQVILDGDVIDWAIVGSPSPDLSNRTSVINAAIRSMEVDRHVDFGPYEIVLLVVGAPPSVPSDGGSTTAKSRTRKHAGIVVRVGDPFDFVAHELGHALGLNHSYGSPGYQNAPWSQPGEYGHPYCVLSANGYGGFGGPYVPPEPRDGRPEYSGLGPSVNAATALRRGWVDAYVHQLPGATVVTELRSRHWLGRNPGLPAQALEVRGTDGKTYVLEYRENDDWDRGQGSPVVIINAGQGSTADLAHPGTHSATYLGMIRLPTTFGGSGSVYNGPGFGIELLDRSVAQHWLRIRLQPGRVSVSAVQLSSAVEVAGEQATGSGETTFDPGEKACVEGTWPFTRIERAQVARFEATYALATSELIATWSVDGVPIVGTSGSIPLPGKQVRVANQMLNDLKDVRTVTVRYEIEAIPQGSRLRLFNAPNDETYNVEVSATLSTAVGSGSALAWEKFTGVEYQYPSAFYERREACLQRFIDVGERYVRYKVLLPPDLWLQIPEALLPRVVDLLGILAQLHERGETAAYQEVAVDLSHLTGIPHLSPLIVRADEAGQLAPQLVEREPHLAVPHDRRPATGLLGLLLAVIAAVRGVFSRIARLFGGR